MSLLIDFLLTNFFCPNVQTTVGGGGAHWALTLYLKGDSRVNTSLSEKFHFYILIFPQKIIFLKNLCFSPQELSGTII